MTAAARIERLDHDHLARKEPPEDIEVVATRGSRVVDARGREYLDLLMGSCVGNLGWAPREVRAAVRGFQGPSYVDPHLLYAPWAQLAAKLSGVAPGKLTRVHRATGGSEAVDIALQAARAYTGRKRFLAVEGSYHGNTLAAIDLPRTLKPPLDERALERLETRLKRRDVAAFVFEPVAINLGVRAPSQEFVDGLREVCDRYGTLVIADEVACGFGRTGKMFASEHFGLEPDVLCLAKAITSGAAPLGATLLREGIAHDVEEDLQAYSTYGWHPLGVAAALATLAWFEKRGDRLMASVVARGAQFRRLLETMPFRGEHEVRAFGLAIAVDVADERYADAIVAGCRERGLLISNDEETLKMFPALTIDAGTVRRSMSVLREVVEA